MPMGLGYLAAAERLGLIYLADTVGMALLLCRFAEQAGQLVADRDSGFLNAIQFDKALDELIDRLADILRGANPRYMATPWFTDPGQLQQSILDDLVPDYLNMADYVNTPDFLARLKADPIHEYALNFLTTVIEPDWLEYTGLNDFISNYVRGALNIPVQVPLPFDAEFTSSMSIRVIRRPPAATEAEADCAES